MNRQVTKGIVLARTNFGEADRILSVITPDYGVLSLMAKGVRKQKSKLAGGIELFSESNITFIKGRGEVDTLISTRLIKHYQNITADLDRTMLGYNLIEAVKKVTREHCEMAHYELLKSAMKYLNIKDMNITVCELWFFARLLWIEGRAPNLTTDSKNQPLNPSRSYSFNYESMAFEPSDNGQFNASHIKLLRIAMAKSPKMLSNVIVETTKLTKTLGLIKSAADFN